MFSGNRGELAHLGARRLDTTIHVSYVSVRRPKVRASGAWWGQSSTTPHHPASTPSNQARSRVLAGFGESWDSRILTLFYSSRDERTFVHSIKLLDVTTSSEHRTPYDSVPKWIPPSLPGTMVAMGDLSVNPVPHKRRARALPTHRPAPRLVLRDNHHLPMVAPHGIPCPIRRELRKQLPPPPHTLNPGMRKARAHYRAPDPRTLLQECSLHTASLRMPLLRTHRVHGRLATLLLPT